MSARCGGFSLIELMLASVIGLGVIFGVMQVALSTRGTQAVQQASIGMQDDGRFVLGKLVREVRMAGMFGCLSTEAIDDAPADFDMPVGISASANTRSLTLVTADVGRHASSPDWTVLSDCLSEARAYVGSGPAPQPGQIGFALRKLTYTFEGGQLKVSTPANPAKTVLVDHVAAFDIDFGVADAPASRVVARYEDNPRDPALIRSVHITLTLHDPARRVKAQTWSAVAAVRNRLE